MSDFFKPEDFYITDGDYKRPGMPTIGSADDTARILANKANAILERRGVRVKTHAPNAGWMLSPWLDEDMIYEAVLVNIKPIAKPDTAESLLRELCERVCLEDSRQTKEAAFNIVRRAKKLLGEP